MSRWNGNIRWLNIIIHREKYIAYAFTNEKEKPKYNAKERETD